MNPTSLELRNVIYPGRNSEKIHGRGRRQKISGYEVGERTPAMGRVDELKLKPDTTKSSFVTRSCRCLVMRPIAPSALAGGLFLTLATMTIWDANGLLIFIPHCELRTHSIKTFLNLFSS